MIKYKNHIDAVLSQNGKNITVTLDVQYNLSLFSFLLINIFSVFSRKVLHDGIFLYGLGLNLAVNSNVDYRNGTAIFNSVKFKKFEGRNFNIAFIVVIIIMPCVINLL